jgi:hypothetical protein
MARKKNRPRQIAAVALAIVGVAGLSVASAAQLTASTTPVIAGVSVDSACDTAVTVQYVTSFSTTLHYYVVTSVTISGINMTAAPPIPSCSGRTLDFTLLDASNAVVATGTSTTISAVTHTVAITPATVNASSVAQIAVIIH